MRHLRYTRPWEIASGLTGLALLAFALVAFFNLDTTSPAFASNAAAAHLSDQAVPAIERDGRPNASDLLAAVLKSQKSALAKIESLSDNPFTTISLKMPDAKADLKTYNGKTFRYLKTLTLRVTAYAPDPRCCYPYDGTTTASGLPVTTNGGRLVAADTSLIPLHYLVAVPGYAQDAAVPVLDRGGAIKGNRLDVLLPTFDQAKKFGVHTVQVKIYQPVK